MKIFLISPPFRVVQEIETIHYFLSLGIDLHIRKENFTPRDMQGYVNMIDKKFHSRCSIHGSMYCSQIEGIRRFHLKSNENVSDLAHEKGNYYSFSKSLHLLKDYHKEKKNYYHYFFLSPIFNSITKKNYLSGFDKRELFLFLNQKKNNDYVPIIALGGIDICNILFTKALGFDGVALLGSIWTQPNFKKRKIKINKILEYLDNCPLSGHAFKCWGSKDFEENT